MASKGLSYLEIILGLIILALDGYWTYESRGIPAFLAIGAVIFVATVIWLAIDVKMMKG